MQSCVVVCIYFYCISLKFNENDLRADEYLYKQNRECKIAYSICLLACNMVSTSSVNVGFLGNVI